MKPLDDAHYMRLAIEASRRAVACGNMPFGAALVRGAVLLHVSSNDQVTASDCTGHAEIVLLREAASKHGQDALRGATVYASGEPCPMCSGAMFWAGIARVVFGATTLDIIAALGGPSMTLGCAEVLAAGNVKIEVNGPILREEASAVLRAFRPPAGAGAG